ncbi:hypothetical protein [Bacillus mycoides]|uniref:hypothetical protein n=1 Tax=Bacillus mycoides TaxID=1405 RepID=UPI000278F448|nr:hypothetical protein [Bacillus mycoides]EJQ55128.1 hypothetical protein IEW_05564 [Bacillus mycoides]EJQ57740.1 hypothetical protein IEY_05557 [Bacillus mycoides]EJV59629.1 hypothetical protein IEU_05556 [Bacillus mycoides]
MEILSQVDSYNTFPQHIKNKMFFNLSGDDGEIVEASKTIINQDIIYKITGIVRARNFPVASYKMVTMSYNETKESFEDKNTVDLSLISRVFNYSEDLAQRVKNTMMSNGYRITKIESKRLTHRNITNDYFRFPDKTEEVTKKIKQIPLFSGKQIAFIESEILIRYNISECYRGLAVAKKAGHIIEFNYNLKNESFDLPHGLQIIDMDIIEKLFTRSTLVNDFFKLAICYSRGYKMEKI